MICEELPVGMCSYSIASSGKRCLLETSASSDGHTQFQCKTSEVIVKNMAELIEGDACVSTCGVERRSVGISSDSLLETQFIAKLCSPACYQNCPNIVDLYYNLALGEGDHILSVHNYLMNKLFTLTTNYQYLRLSLNSFLV